MRLQRLFLLGVTFLALAPGTATAYGWAGGYSGAWAGWWPASRTYTQEYIPYFAKHPPVYYTRPTPRTYGHLPYPYWPTTHAPQTVAAQPIVVQNHFAPGNVPPGPAEDRTSPAPRRIINPFAHEPKDPMPVPDEAPISEPEA